MVLLKPLGPFSPLPLAGKRSGHVVAERHVERALASAGDRGLILSGEQQAALRHVTAPRDLGLIIGYAGSGKSAMLGVAREAWEAQGYTVRGAALSGIAAENLEQGSGIASRTIASLEHQWARGRDQLGSGDVLVIDEAGMIGSTTAEASGSTSRATPRSTTAMPPQSTRRRGSRSIAPTCSPRRGSMPTPAMSRSVAMGRTCSSTTAETTSSHPSGWRACSGASAPRTARSIMPTCASGFWPAAAEDRAAAILHKSRWDAGMELMAMGDPARWRQLVDADTFQHETAEAVRTCRNRANSTARPVRCSIEIAPNAPLSRAVLHR